MKPYRRKTPLPLAPVAPPIPTMRVGGRSDVDFPRHTSRSGRIIESDDGFVCTRCQGETSSSLASPGVVLVSCQECGASREVLASDEDARDPHGEEA